MFLTKKQLIKRFFKKMRYAIQCFVICFTIELLFLLMFALCN
jgi:hypothetical protein